MTATKRLQIRNQVSLLLFLLLLPICLMVAACQAGQSTDATATAPDENSSPSTTSQVTTTAELPPTTRTSTTTATPTTVGSISAKASLEWSSSEVLARGMAFGPEKTTWIRTGSHLWTVRDDNVTIEAEIPDSAQSGYSITVDRDGVVWVDAMDEIYAYDGQSWSRFDTGLSIPTHEDCLRVFALPDGRLIVQCRQAIPPTVTVFDGETSATYEAGTEAGTPWSLATHSYDVGSDGTFGTVGPGGFARFRNGEWDVHVYRPFIKSDDYPLTVADDGTLWAASFDDVLHFDGDSVDIIDSAGVPSRFSAMAASPNGSIWAIASNRLYQLDGESWTEHRLQLPRGIIGIDVDPSGNLWVLATHGIIRYSP